MLHDTTNVRSELGLSLLAGFGYDYDHVFPILIRQANEVSFRLYSIVVDVFVRGMTCVVGLFGNSIFVVFNIDKRRSSITFFFNAPVTTLLSHMDLMLDFDMMQLLCLVCTYPCACTAQTVDIQRYIAVCRPHKAGQLCKLSLARKQAAFDPV